jgi:hypothetical protein
LTIEWISWPANLDAPASIRLTTFLTERLFELAFSGDSSEGETPVPIPNTAVKPLSADGTAATRPWESGSLPGSNLFEARAASDRVAGLRFFAGGDGRRQE